MKYLLILCLSLNVFAQDSFQDQIDMELYQVALELGALEKEVLEIPRKMNEPYGQLSHYYDDIAGDYGSFTPFGDFPTTSAIHTVTVGVMAFVLAKKFVIGGVTKGKWESSFAGAAVGFWLGEFSIGAFKDSSADYSTSLYYVYESEGERKILSQARKEIEDASEAAATKVASVFLLTPEQEKEVSRAIYSYMYRNYKVYAVEGSEFIDKGPFDLLGFMKKKGFALDKVELLEESVRLYEKFMSKKDKESISAKMDENINQKTIYKMRDIARKLKELESEQEKSTSPEVIRDLEKVGDNLEALLEKQKLQDELGE